MKMLNPLYLRIVALACIVVALGGCATAATLVPIGSLGDKKRTFELFDLRPKEQFETFSKRVEQGDYHYYGDDVIIPGRVEMLADRLQEELGSKLNGMDLQVKSFEVSTFQGTNRGSAQTYYSSGNPLVDVIGVTLGRELLAATTRSTIVGVSALIEASVNGVDYRASVGRSVESNGLQPGIANVVRAAIDDYIKQVKGSMAPNEVKSVPQKGTLDEIQ